jgi:hypothetical protein
MNGNCTGHADPDMWFPELPPNRPSIAVTAALAARVNEAISLCKSCLTKVECDSEGSKPENRAYGIWGGILAGERLLELGVKRDELPNYAPETSAIDIFNRLSPWLER